MNKEGKAKVIGQIIAKCWEDEKFKEHFKTDTAAVLKEFGMDVPKGIKFNVIEEIEGVVDIIIPVCNQALSDEELDSAAGGFCNMGAPFFCYRS